MGSGILHTADASGMACVRCGTEFGGPKTKLTVPPGTRVVSTGVEPGVGYQSWFMPDNDIVVDAEPCPDLGRERGVTDGDVS